MARARDEARDIREICGLLIDNGCFLQMKVTRNRSRRRGSFVLDQREIKKIRQASKTLGLKVVGTFHSHPISPAQPGRTDIEGAAAGSLMLIFDSIGKEVRLWRIQNGRAYAMGFELVA
jgi:proteasome lid subunit RPN8/RPN11